MAKTSPSNFFRSRCHGIAMAKTHQLKNRVLPTAMVLPWQKPSPRPVFCPTAMVTPWQKPQNRFLPTAVVITMAKTFPSPSFVSHCHGCWSWLHINIAENQGAACTRLCFYRPSHSALRCQNSCFKHTVYGVLPFNYDGCCPLLPLRKDRPLYALCLYLIYKMLYNTYYCLYEFLSVCTVIMPPPTNYSAGIFPRKRPLGGGSCHKSPESSTFNPPNGRTWPLCVFLWGFTSTTTSRNFMSTSASKDEPTIPNSSMINHRQYKLCSPTAFWPGSARGVLPLLEIYVYIYIYLVSILINWQPLFFF